MSDEEIERPGRRPHPKNTKRWCKGREGVEHITELVVPVNAMRGECDTGERNWTGTFNWEIGCYHVEQCIVCGKHVRPFLNKGECPDREENR